MTTIKPCRLCPIREGCEQRDEFRRRIRGLGLQTASFRCDRLTKEIRPGRRVVISHPFLVEADSGWQFCGSGSAVQREVVSATITHVDLHHAFTCTIDYAEFDDRKDIAMDGEDETFWAKRFRRRQPHTRIIRFLGEPDRSICGLGNVGIPGECDNRGACYCNRLLDDQ